MKPNRDGPLLSSEPITIPHYGVMESTRTISELKSSFIRAQVRILSEGLEPPEDWRNYAAETEEDDLSDKVVGDVLQKCKCKHPESNLHTYHPGITAHDRSSCTVVNTYIVLHFAYVSNESMGHQ